MKFLVLLFLLVSSSVIAQAPTNRLSDAEKKEYRKIKSHVKAAPSYYSSPDQLADYLTAPYSSDLMKVRSIYLWMTENIAYDMKAFLSNDLSNQTVLDVLEKRTAVCEGYANLFYTLSENSGLQAAKISGFSKGYGYEPGQKFVVSNHAWNAVKVEEEWYLIDTSWGATSTNEPGFGSSRFQETYFMPDPREFLKDHLPEDSTWQMISNPISLNDFEEGKNVETSVRRKFKQPQDPTSREIALYERTVRSNPADSRAHFRLGYAYLTKAMENLEGVHEITEPAVRRKMDSLEQQVIPYLESARSEFLTLNRGDQDYETAQKLLVECTYHHGVFCYEVGYQFLSLLYDHDEESYDSAREQFDPNIREFWNRAIHYFEQIPPGNIFYEQARNYIDHYIAEYMP